MEDPNTDPRTSAIGQIILELRQQGVKPEAIPSILELVAQVCDIEIEYQNREHRQAILKTIKEVEEHTITPDIALSRMALRTVLPQTPQITPEEQELIREYREDQYTIREIAQIFERSTETIHRHTKTNKHPEPAPPSPNST